MCNLENRKWSSRINVCNLERGDLMTNRIKECERNFSVACTVSQSDGSSQSGRMMGSLKQYGMQVIITIRCACIGETSH